MPDSEAITYTTLRLISAFGAWFGANPRAVPTVMDFVLKGMMDGAFRLIRKEKKGGGGVVCVSIQLLGYGWQCLGWDVGISVFSACHRSCGSHRS